MNFALSLISFYNECLPLLTATLFERRINKFCSQKEGLGVHYWSYCFFKLYTHSCRLAGAESDERGQEVDASEEEVRFLL